MRPRGCALETMDPIDDAELGLDKDQPLREDVRLLGRLLGDTLRERQGDAAFTLVEAIRQTAVRFRRNGQPDARTQLQLTLSGLSDDATVAVARAFSYFSQMSNIAEDLHRNRRHRAHQFAASAALPGSLAHAIRRAKVKGITASEIQKFFNGALVMPVLTAHPTEVQRKSILDGLRDIAVLLHERDRVQLTPSERAHNEDGLRRAILTLWQTRVLRELTLSVRDEIDNGLSYFDTTFLEQLPRLYGEIEDSLNSHWPGGFSLPAFMKVGTWIGGDRDGNPQVNAAVLHYAHRAPVCRRDRLLFGRSPSTSSGAFPVAALGAGDACRRAARRALRRSISASARRTLPPGFESYA